MNLKRLTTVAYKEWREILRDRIFFSLAFILPIILMLVFGYGLTRDVDNVPFAVLDYDHSYLSRAYAGDFINSRYFDFKGYLHGIDQINSLLTDGRLRFVIIIPENFQKDIDAERVVAVQTLMDGVFIGPMRIIQGYINAINNARNKELQASYIVRHASVPLETAYLLLEPIKIEIRYLYNQEVRISWDMTPSLIVFILMLTAPLLTSLSVVREKETGAIYNIYTSTISRSEFLLGKLTPSVLISFFNAIILWLMAIFYFETPFKGNAAFFLIATFLYVICVSSIGLLISLLVKSQIAAMMISAVMGFAVGIQFSGMITPINSLTKDNFILAHLFPAMYYNTVVQSTFLKGLGPDLLWTQLLIFLCYSFIVLSLCYFLFRKRIRN